jgi:four helix bundle protein
MSGFRRFEDIKAWQKARELVREVYEVCSQGGFTKDFGLKDQICRAAVSAMSNVAEGFARQTNRDFARFLDIAKGSAVEVQSLLYVALDVKYVSKEKFERLYAMADETISYIFGLASYVRKHRPSGQEI